VIGAQAVRWGMIALTCWCLLQAAGPWRTYEVYQPDIRRVFVNETHAQPLKYNHDSSIAWFDDCWFCLWNANLPPAEGKPGQLNYQSTSRDGVNWSPPVACFTDPAQTATPIPCPGGTQWQPNLLVVNGELWAVWSQNSRDQFNGTYLSRLSSPDGQWRSSRMLFDGEPAPLIEGRRWRIFATQNPYQLRSGRVLAPVTISDETAVAKDAPEGVTGWWAREKRNSVLWTDDLGQTWHCSPGAIQPGRSWAQWEPTVWQVPDGRVLMAARNNDFRGRAEEGHRPAEMLLQAESRDGGETWTPHRYIPLQTVASRMHVLPLEGDRYVMVHNDWPAGRFVADRQNLALFICRGAGFDFVAGPGLTQMEPVCAYPQMAVHDGRMLISYSQGASYRSIKVVSIEPLPAPDRYYLFPRDNAPGSPRPAVVDGGLVFRGDQQMTSREPLVVPDAGYTIVAEVRGEGGGTILDSRPGNPPGGVLFGLMGRKPFVYLHNADNNIPSPLELPDDNWHTIAATVDSAAKQVIFRVDDQTAVVKLTEPPGQTLAGTTARIGAKRFERSGVQPLHADLSKLAVYAAVLPAEQQLNPRLLAVLRLDASDETALARDFELPPDAGHGVEFLPDTPPRLRLRGLGSAGIDLDDNERANGDQVEFELKFRPRSPVRQTILTIGDANHPARLVAEAGVLKLEAEGVAKELGAAPADVWTAVTVSTGGEQTMARCGGATATVTHQPEGTWAYLGEGYRDGEWQGEVGSVEVELGSFRTRVVR